MVPTVTKRIFNFAEKCKVINNIVLSLDYFMVETINIKLLVLYGNHYNSFYHVDRYNLLVYISSKKPKGSI